MNPQKPFDPVPAYYATPAYNQAFTEENAPPPGARLHHEYQQQKVREVRMIQLTSGNLVVDCPVPDRVLQNAIYRENEEFTHLRYTACTCDPNNFVNEKYTLRPVLYGRETEVAIVMTMYFALLISGIMKMMYCSVAHSTLLSRTSHTCAHVTVHAYGAMTAGRRL